MNVQYPTKFIFRNVAVTACRELILSHLGAYSFPTRTVFSPSTFPSWIIFTTPIGSFPGSKAGSITEEMLLPTLLFFSNIPNRKFLFMPTIDTSYDTCCNAIRPPAFQPKLSSAGIITKVSFSQAIRLKFKLFATISAICFYAISLGCRIVLGYILTPTRHGAKPPILDRFFQYVRLDFSGLPTISTVDFCHIIQPS